MLKYPWDYGGPNDGRRKRVYIFDVALGDETTDIVIDIAGEPGMPVPVIIKKDKLPAKLEDDIRSGKCHTYSMNGEPTTLNDRIHSGSYLGARELTDEEMACLLEQMKRYDEWVEEGNEISEVLERTFFGD